MCKCASVGVFCDHYVALGMVFSVCLYLELVLKKSLFNLFYSCCKNNLEFCYGVNIGDEGYCDEPGYCSDITNRYWIVELKYIHPF